MKGSDLLAKKSHTRKDKTQTNSGIPTDVIRPKGSDSTGGQVRPPMGLSSSAQVLNSTPISGINTGSYQNINGRNGGKPGKKSMRHITVIETFPTVNDDVGRNPDPEIDEVFRSKAFVKRSVSENPISKSNQRDEGVFLDISLKPRNAAPGFVEDVASETSKTNRSLEFIGIKICLQYYFNGLYFIVLKKTYLRIFVNSTSLIELFFKQTIKMNELICRTL